MKNGIAATFIQLNAIVILILALTGCLNDEDSSYLEILESGTLKVGMDASYPPFEYLHAETGELSGFDVDLAHIIAEQLGVELNIINISYDGLYDALLVGQVDLLISGLVAAPEYYSKASFSQSYFNAGERLVSHREAPLLNLENLEDELIGVEHGSGGDVIARQLETRSEEVTIIRFNTSSEALSSLLIKQVDAVILDGISAHLATANDPSLIMGPALSEQPYAIAFHPDADGLRSEVGKILDELIENGVIDQLLEEHFLRTGHYEFQP